MTSEDPIQGRVVSVVATIECGGCAKQMRFNIDSAADSSPGQSGQSSWSLFDEVVDVVRGGNQGLDEGMTSVQGGYLLCPECTSKVDDAVTEDRNATADEVRSVLADSDREADLEDVLDVTPREEDED